MIYGLIFIVGLIFGSFSSVVIHRLHTEEKGILRGRSKCPHCAKQLQAIDLIPVVSFLLNKCKCRFCKTPISFRYPLLELSMGGLFLLTSLLIGVEDIFQLVFYLAISWSFIVLTFYDFLFQEVPDEVSVPTFLVTTLYMAFYGPYSGASLTIGILIPILFFGILHFGSKGRWMGGGDIRVGAIMGALLGYPIILVGMFFGYLTGSVFSVAGILMKKLGRGSQIPFVPFLLLGTYVAMFWGQEAFDWYMGLM